MGQEQNSIERRKWKQLSEKERYKIEALTQQGLSPAEIGRSLEPQRDRRTIERELRRGSVVQRRLNPYVSRNPEVPEYLDEERYLADFGQRKKEERACNKGRGYKIGQGHDLMAYLEEKIGKERWSPDAAIGYIKASGLVFSVNICTKTVYNMLDRGDFLNLTNKDLPVKRSNKKRGYRHIRRVALNNIKGLSIEERPLPIEKREEYGHWEMDSVVGSGKACLLVMTERKSRQERIFKIAAKTQECVNTVIDRLERKYRSSFKIIFKSITMDNGGEFLDTQNLERSCLKPNSMRTTCYYAHPYSAFERGSNEAANKIIRRFVPKGSNIDKLSHKDVAHIENWMNNYPRRMFGYKTANDMTPSSLPPRGQR